MRDFTDITILLDRSGSMDSIKSDVIGGFNGFVDKQKGVGENASLTLVLFDGQSIDTVYTAMPINDVSKLTEATYQPRANTPLLDALGSTIHKTGERLAALNESDRPDKVVFVTTTDGLENASKEYTKAGVRSLTDQQESVYKWQFIYLGANQDAFNEAGQLGYASARVANFAPQNVASAMRVASSNVASYRVSNDARKLEYTDEQREELLKPKSDKK